MTARLALPLLLSLLLLPAWPARADPTPERWGGLVSVGGGVFTGRGFLKQGHLLSAHLLVTTPSGLELGLALQRGRTFETRTVYPSATPVPEEARPSSVPWGSFRGLGLEGRYRFLRARSVSPWLALRLGYSRSTLIDTTQGRPFGYTGRGLAVALGAGVDVGVHGPFGLIAGGYFQVCDLNARPRFSYCSGTGPTLVLSPRLRF